MIQSYYRPKSIEEAIELLSKQEINPVPIGGGSVVSRMKTQDIAVVDLQALGLDKVALHGNQLSIGATTPLEKLAQARETPPGLIKAIRLESGSNLRRQASIAGALISADGRSPVAAAFAALDADMIWLPGNIEVNYGNWLPLREQVGKLVVSIQIPANANLEIESVGRTPFDRPIVLVAVARWPSGRTRVVLGGFGNAPILAMDGPEGGGADEAVRDALTQANDSWASAAYRQSVAARLTRRILQSRD